ncbi:unnamed protein product [Blepharisma stoltei]|uniref:Protein kinase domain-containing protein n=1 Tax=Blepharisma stoltei TaxID=1481888 RepID=A0AAU9JJP2_9CILI|nr:unnamed protein product [Blepharisma stoltei]
MAEKSRANDYEIIGDLDKSRNLLKVVRKSDNSTYAMKVVKIPQSEKRNQQELINEVKILTNLKQQDSFRYFDSFFEKNTLHVVMELNEKSDLSNQIKSQIEGNQLIHLCLRQKRARESLSKIRDNLPDISELKRPKIERSKAFYWGNFKSRYVRSSSNERNDNRWREDLPVVEIGNKNQEESEGSLESWKKKNLNQSCVEEVIVNKRDIRTTHEMENPINELQKDQQTIKASNIFYPSFFVHNPKEIPIEDSGFVDDNDELINIESDATPTFNKQPSTIQSFFAPDSIQTQASTLTKDSELKLKPIQGTSSIPINQSVSPSFFTQSQKETIFSPPEEKSLESKPINCQPPKNSVPLCPSFFVQNPQEVPIEDSGFVDESSNDSSKIQENASPAQNKTDTQENKGSLFQSPIQSSFKPLFEKKPNPLTVGKPQIIDKNLQSPIFTKTTSLPLYTKTAPLSLGTKTSSLPSFFVTNPSSEIPLEDPGFMDDADENSEKEIEENPPKLDNKLSLFNPSPISSQVKSIFDKSSENKAASLFGGSLFTQTNQDSQPKLSLLSSQTAETKSLFDKSAPSLFSTQAAATKSLFDKPAPSLFSSQNQGTKSLFSAQPISDKPSSSLFPTQPISDKPSSSLFSAQNTSDKAAPSLFSAQPTSDKPCLFANQSTSDKAVSLFSNKETKSLFDKNSSFSAQKSIFDSTPTQKKEEKSLFGQTPLNQKQEPGSLFGNSSTAANNQNLISAAKPQANNQTSSFFVQNVTADIPFDDPGFADDSNPNSEDGEGIEESKPSGPQNSLFGQRVEISTTSSPFKNIFEAKTDEKPKGGSLFDIKSEGKSTGGSLFDLKYDEKPKEGSLFDIKSEGRSTGGSLFDLKYDEKPKEGSLFGIKNENKPIEGSLFGKKNDEKPKEGLLFGIKNEDKPTEGSLFGKKNDEKPKMPIFEEKRPEMSLQTPTFRAETQSSPQVSSFFVSNPTSEIPLEDPGFLDQDSEKDSSEAQKEASPQEPKLSLFKGVPQPAPPSNSLLKSIFEKKPDEKSTSSNSSLPKTNAFPSFFVANPIAEVPIEDPGFLKHSNDNSADEDAAETVKPIAKPSLFGTPMPNEKTTPIASLFGGFFKNPAQMQSTAASQSLFSPSNITQIPYKFSTPGNPIQMKPGTFSSFFVANPPAEIPLEDPGFAEDSDKEEPEAS